MKKKRGSFQIFVAVVKALLLREIQTRFGSQKLGYLWAVVEPMATVVVFAFIKELLHPNGMPGISYPVFLASGMLPYFMFRNIVVRSMDAFDANRGLFVYKQVKPFDTLFSRFLVEVSLTSVITLIFVFIGLYFNFEIEPKNLLGVIIAYLWIALFGFGVGIFVGVLGYFFENLKKIVNLLFLPLYFLSAIFYTLDTLPPLAREILYYNPVVHFIEMIHFNYFYGINSVYFDYTYMLLWTLIPMFTGLWLYKKSERRILMV